jgi:DNA-binding MarR family transcriptional regulator
MAQSNQSEADKSRLMLNLLDSVGRDGSQSQRRLAVELGIALGLVNLYLKRCIRKGFVKVSNAPAKRYAYFLTVEGFAEKSRLTLEYLTYSFSFFRQARLGFDRVFADIASRGGTLIVLAGISDLAEIATICSIERKLSIVAIVDPQTKIATFLGHPVMRSIKDVEGPFDAVIVTDLKTPYEVYSAAIEWCGKDMVYVPNLLLASIEQAASA